MKQQDLLRESKATIEIADACREPRVWIRRLVIWSTPDKIVQDITFNRGLNIVWSPDTSDAKEKDKQKRHRGSGHGAGKTLLCRLIRYCLGEDTFASKELEDQVRTSFKEGLVGGEVIIDGSSWGVVRPIGIGRKTRVGENQPLEELIEANGTGIEPLVAAIRSSVLGAELVDVMAGSHEAKDWLHALAWLTRDQEARYNHLLEWRTATSDSESPVASEAKDQLDDAARLLVGAMTVAEVASKKELAVVVATIARCEREGAYLARLASELEQETLKSAGMEEFVGAVELAIPQAAARIREQIEAAERPVDESALVPLRTRRDQHLAEQGRLSGERARLNGVVALQNSNLNQIKGELTTLPGRSRRSWGRHTAPSATSRSIVRSPRAAGSRSRHLIWYRSRPISMLRTEFAPRASLRSVITGSSSKQSNVRAAKSREGLNSSASRTADSSPSYTISETPSVHNGGRQPAHSSASNASS